MTASAIAVSTPAALPIRRLLRAYFMEAKYETLRTLRAPAFAGPFLAIPIAMYLFFGMLGGSGPSTRAASMPPGPFLFTGFLVMGIMGPPLFGFGMNIALEREQGLLQLKRAQPMPKGAYLLAKLLMSIVFAALVGIELAIAAAVMSRAPVTAAQLTSVVVVGMPRRYRPAPNEFLGDCSPGSPSWPTLFWNESRKRWTNNGRLSR